MKKEKQEPGIIRNSLHAQGHRGEMNQEHDKSLLKYNVLLKLKLLSFAPPNQLTLTKITSRKTE